MNKKATNKKLHALVGLFLVAVIMLTGTWAWQSFNQGGFNPAGGRQNPGGRTHDIYQVSNHATDPTRGAGTFDLSIFGENFGAEDLRLRIRLHEFLQIGDDVVGDADIQDPTTWPVFNINGVFNADGTFDAADRVGYSYEIAELGNVEWNFGGQRVFFPTLNRLTEPVVGTADYVANTNIRPYFQQEHAHLFTDTVGRAVDALAGTALPSGDYPEVNATDAYEFFTMGIQTGVNVGDAIQGFGATGARDEWAEGDINPIVNPILLFTNDLGFADYRVLDETADAELLTARYTLGSDFGGVMTFDQWVSGELTGGVRFAAGNFWILDTNTGWFYWNGVVPAAESEELSVATSLLLNAVQFAPNGVEWDYVIHADSQWWADGYAPLNANPLLSRDLQESDYVVIDGNSPTAAADFRAAVIAGGIVVLDGDVDTTNAITIPAGVETVITGSGTIAHTTANRQFVIDVDSVLTIQGDITLTRSAQRITDGLNGGGVAVRTGGHFILSGGTITNNLIPNDDGTAVLLLGGRFDMFSGTISNNIARLGGGITANGANGILNLFSGTIYGNTANETLSNGIRLGPTMPFNAFDLSSNFDLQDGLFQPNLEHTEGFIRFADGEIRTIQLPGPIRSLYFSQTTGILTSTNHTSGVITVNWMGTYLDVEPSQLVEFHPNGTVVVQ